MTMTSIVTEAERYVARTARRLTAPQRQECLACYLCRTLPQLGCDGQLRLTRRWQRAQQQSTGGLTRYLRAGGGFCDCEVVFNVFGVDPAGDGPPCG